MRYRAEPERAHAAAKREAAHAPMTPTASAKSDEMRLFICLPALRERFTLNIEERVAYANRNLSFRAALALLLISRRLLPPARVAMSFDAALAASPRCRRQITCATTTLPRQPPHSSAARYGLTERSLLIELPQDILIADAASLMSFDGTHGLLNSLHLVPSSACSLNAAAPRHSPRSPS